MRLIILSLCILLASSIVACSDKKEDYDNNNLELTTDYFNQSAWTGELVYKEKNGDINNKYTIGFTFISDKIGKFTVFKTAGQGYYDSENFRYSVDKKRLTLLDEKVNAATSLGIYWFVVEKSKNKLVLAHNLETELSTRYLYLNRTY